LPRSKIVFSYTSVTLIASNVRLISAICKLFASCLQAITITISYFQARLNYITRETFVSSYDCNMKI